MGSFGAYYAEQYDQAVAELSRLREREAKLVEVAKALVDKLDTLHTMLDDRRVVVEALPTEIVIALGLIGANADALRALVEHEGETT